jgi:NAD(P)-dependent dehydrogenase (short-subunit alcohol dehydrogenase family)
MSDNTKTILVTGATSGIGKATVQELVKHAKVLILPVRTMSKGEELKTELALINPDCVIDLYELQLTSLESVKSFANSILTKYQVLDTIINNAGIFNDSRVLTDDGIEETFQVNVLSQFILNNMLLPLLKAAPEGRIINLSSMGHLLGKFDIDNIQAEKATKNNMNTGTQIYFNSNLYRNLLTFKLAKLLSGTKVVANCLHPGAIASGLATQNKSFWAKPMQFVFKYFTKSPVEGAKTSIFLALDPAAGKISGRYWNKCNTAKPLAISNNEEYQNQLWDYCTRIAKL